MLIPIPCTILFVLLTYVDAPKVLYTLDDLFIETFSHDF